VLFCFLFHFFFLFFFWWWGGVPLSHKPLELPHYRCLLPSPIIFCKDVKGDSGNLACVRIPHKITCSLTHSLTHFDSHTHSPLFIHSTFTHSLLCTHTLSHTHSHTICSQSLTPQYTLSQTSQACPCTHTHMHALTLSQTSWNPFSKDPLLKCKTDVLHWCQPLRKDS
jgi:hypothetical protein